MVPWNNLPKDLQKTILALILMSGSSSLQGCVPPMVCDPPPPPRTATPPVSPSRITGDRAASPTHTRAGTPPPIICDPAPPPSVTRTRTRTPPPPIICDPAPPPATSRTPTPADVRRFQLRRLEITSDPAVNGAVVRGTVLNRSGQPMAGVSVALQVGGTRIQTTSGRDGTFLLQVSTLGSYQLSIGDDRTSAIPLLLKDHDVATVEWAELGTQSSIPLPLAEIRTVDIVWGDDLQFHVDTAWTGARCRWSVSGGTLLGEGEHVTWEPPAEPGRYLLQLIADWGYEGLAVDSLVLTVNADGTIFIA